MTIVVLPGSHGVNGSNTVGLRYGRHRASSGERVVFPLFHRFGGHTFELLESWRRIAEIVPVRGRWVLDLAGAAARMPAPERFFAMTADGLSYSIEWQRRFFPGARIVAAVYHPRQYREGGYTELHRRRYRRVFADFPDENVLFVDVMTRDWHAELFGRSFSGSPVVPVPVEVPDVNVAARRHDPFSVVSVGRLVDFKYHHHQVIRALGTLRQRGVPVTYTVHGGGPLEERLRRDIQELGAGSWARAAGHLPYDRFAATVSRAWAFVGMGTALIETALHGVPALVTAMERTEEATTNGWYHELDGLNLGEIDPALTMVPILRSFEQLLALSPDEYRAAGERSRAMAMEAFGSGTVMRRYDDVLAGAAPYTYRGPDLLDRVLLPASVAERIVRRVVRDPAKHHT